jgi:hypothetical protein
MFKKIILSRFSIPTYIHKYIGTTYPRSFIPEGVAEASHSTETPTFYQNDLAMRYTADVTGGKAIAI